MVAIGDSRCTSQRVRVRVKESSENVTKQEHLIEKLTRCSVEEALRYRIDDLLSSRNQLGHGRLSVFLLWILVGVTSILVTFVEIVKDSISVSSLWGYYSADAQHRIARGNFVTKWRSSILDPKQKQSYPWTHPDWTPPSVLEPSDQII
jgi:hypothetical protein